jgi:hypothetical protein
MRVGRTGAVTVIVTMVYHEVTKSTKLTKGSFG